jgi:hypothetical protein
MMNCIIRSFRICTFHQILLETSNKEDELGEVM